VQFTPPSPLQLPHWVSLVCTLTGVPAQQSCPAPTADPQLDVPPQNVSLVSGLMQAPPQQS
jgi:hypothetical protein